MATTRIVLKQRLDGGRLCLRTFCRPVEMTERVVCTPLSAVRSGRANHNEAAAPPQACVETKRPKRPRASRSQRCPHRSSLGAHGSFSPWSLPVATEGRRQRASTEPRLEGCFCGQDTRANIGESPFSPRTSARAARATTARASLTSTSWPTGGSASAPTPTPWRRAWSASRPTRSLAKTP